MTQSGLNVQADDAPPPLSTPAIIARNIRRLREGKGISQAACAARLGVAPATWSTWETMFSPVPTTKLDDIARILDITVVALVTVEL